MDTINWDQIKAIFIDFDGTLADSLPALYETYLDFLHHYQKEGTQEEFQDLNGPTLKEIISHLKSKHQLLENPQALLNVYQKILQKAYSHRVQLFPNLLPFLEWAREQKIELAIVSSAPHDLIDSFLSSHQLHRYFTFIMSEKDVDFSKPHPAPYQKALSKIGLEPHQVIAIEDSLNGLKSAQSAFIPTIALHLPKTLVPSSAIPAENWSALLALFKTYWNL